MGKPSITYNGSLFPVIDEVPRTRMEIPPPGAAARPRRAASPPSAIVFLCLPRRASR
jgi:hypothetical protein